MSSAVEKLVYQISLIDKITGPAKKAAGAAERVRNAWRFASVEFTVAGTIMNKTVGALHNLSMPAREFSKALGEVESLGVARKELDKLAEASRDFTAEFGGDAAEIVRSAYDIQSAIPGLGEGALAAFTTQGALLAKATKADAATITAYQGTMYSIFKREAETIGQAKWVDQLTGKTAKAVQMFKTTGEAMSAAFTNLGSTAQLSGVGIDEQMAVLGTLQATMGGESAGTAYKAMLINVAKAGKVLNMNFTDAQGKMLPIVEILEKIKAKTGATNLKTADTAALVSAFGKQGAQAVMNLLAKTDELRGSIGELNKVESSLNAAEMAEKMVDPLDKFQGNLQNLKIVFGQALLPVVNSLLAVLTVVMKRVTWALEKIPGARAVLTGLTVVLTGLVFVLAGMKIIVGVTALVKNFHDSFRMLNVICYKTLGISLKQIGVWIWQKTVMVAKKVATLALAAAQWVMNGSLWGAVTATWAWTVALLACPITWIVLGVVALIAGLVLLIVYWDDVKAAFVRFWEYIRPAVDMLGSALMWLIDPIGQVLTAFLDWDRIKAFFGGVVDWIAGLFSGIKDAFCSWWDKIAGPIKRVWNWFSGGGDDPASDLKAQDPVLPPSSGRSFAGDIPAGGVRSSTVNHTTNYGGVTINAANAPGAGELEEWMLLAGG